MKKYVYILIICLLVMTGCMKDKVLPDAVVEKDLVCTKDITASGIPMFQTASVKYIGNKVDVIDSNILVTLPEQYKSSIDKFVESFKKEYDESYKNMQNVEINVSKKSDSEIYIDLVLDYKNMSEEEKKSSNLIGSEDYDVNKLQFEKKGYTCK